MKFERFPAGCADWRTEGVIRHGQAGVCTRIPHGMGMALWTGAAKHCYRLGYLESVVLPLTVHTERPGMPMASTKMSD